MKAYLNFQGFTRMIEIPRPMPEILIPIIESITVHEVLPIDDTGISVLKFYKNGELHGGDEVILRYTWDGIFPKGKK